MVEAVSAAKDANPAEIVLPKTSDTLPIEDDEVSDTPSDDAPSDNPTSPLPTPHPPSPPRTRSRSTLEKPISSRLRSKPFNFPPASAHNNYIKELSCHINHLNSTPSDSLTHRATMKSPLANEWKRAEQEEIDSLISKKV